MVIGLIVGAAFIIAFFIAVAFIILIVIIGEFNAENSAPIRLLLFVLIAFLALLATVIFMPLEDDLSKSLLLFLGFLPLINAVFDYFSIGLTRYLLQNSLDSGLPWIRGLLDAVAAIILFVLLKLTLVTLFVLLTDSNNNPLIQLGGDHGLFQGLRTDPNGYIWLYFTLFSTLIPAVLVMELKICSA